MTKMKPQVLICTTGNLGLKCTEISMSERVESGGGGRCGEGEWDRRL